MSEQFDVRIPGVVLEQVIGRGSSSVVYLGTQERFGRKVAVKVLDAAPAGQTGIDPFVAECRILGRLSIHPDIVTVLDGDRLPDGRAYLVLAYLPGGSLADRQQKEGEYSAAEVSRIGVRLAGALESAHRHRVAHGDVKPQNVLWTRSGEPALVDFGVAQMLSEETARPTSMTPAHAAPELLAGGSSSPASDVYGLASTMFELVVGSAPHRDSSTNAPELSPLNEVDEAFAAVVSKALSLNPGDRFGSAAEFGEALRETQRNAGLEQTQMVIVDPEDSVDERFETFEFEDALTLPPPTNSGNRRIGLGVAAVVGALVLIGVGIVFSRSQQNEVSDAAADTTSSVPKTSSSSIKELTTSSVPESPSSSVKVLTTGPTPPAKGSQNRPPGLQADVNYDVAGVTPTDRILASVLADDSIFSALGPTALVFDYSLDVQRYPASVSYQFYNADSKSTCPGFYSADTVLRGGLTKGIKWGTPQDNLGVIILQQFESVAEARTAVAGIALSLGPTGKSCSALPTESQTELMQPRCPHHSGSNLKRHHFRGSQNESTITYLLSVLTRIPDGSMGQRLPRGREPMWSA